MLGSFREGPGHVVRHWSSSRQHLLTSVTFWHDSTPVCFLCCITSSAARIPREGHSLLGPGHRVFCCLRLALPLVLGVWAAASSLLWNRRQLCLSGRSPWCAPQRMWLLGGGSCTVGIHGWARPGCPRATCALWVSCPAGLKPKPCLGVRPRAPRLRCPQPLSRGGSSSSGDLPCPLSCRKSAPSVGSRPALARSGPCGCVRSAVSRER